LVVKPVVVDVRHPSCTTKLSCGMLAVALRTVIFNSKPNMSADVSKTWVKDPANDAFAETAMCSAVRPEAKAWVLGIDIM